MSLTKTAAATLVKYRFGVWLDRSLYRGQNSILQKLREFMHARLVNISVTLFCCHGARAAAAPGPLGFSSFIFLFLPAATSALGL